MRWYVSPPEFDFAGSSIKVVLTFGNADPPQTADTRAQAKALFKKHFDAIATPGAAPVLVEWYRVQQQQLSIADEISRAGEKLQRLGLDEKAAHRDKMGDELIDDLNRIDAERTEAQRTHDRAKRALELMAWRIDSAKQAADDALAMFANQAQQAAHQEISAQAGVVRQNLPPEVSQFIDRLIEFYRVNTTITADRNDQGRLFSQQVVAEFRQRAENEIRQVTIEKATKEKAQQAGQQAGEQQQRKK